LAQLPSGRETPPAAELAAVRIGVQFQGLRALTDVSLTIDPCVIVGLIGPNGAGKTTLVNCMTGFQRPTTGRILLNQNGTTGWGPERFRKAGVARTFQAGRLFNDMSVVENIEVTGVALGLSRRQSHAHACDLLRWLGIVQKSDVPAKALPYTDQRRVGIARALMLSPAFILMDEPAAGMSDSECEDLMKLISSIPVIFGCGVLIIEHNMSVIMSVSQRVHVLDGGRSIAEGTSVEIQNDSVVIGAYLGMEA
jgi:branched-chain amino acid transport system ATP-binding protein